MRNKKIVVCLCLGLLLVTVGCSNSNADSDVTIVDTSNYKDQSVKENMDNQQGSDHESDRQQDKQSDSAQSQPDSSQPQADNESLQLDSELDGIIESIGTNSVVINKIFYPEEDMAMSYEGSDKVLVTVYFSEETNYEVRVVKNGGVNGDADTEKRQGTFSDLQEGGDISMTGYYNGNDFQAQNVIIYNFI